MKTFAAVLATAAVAAAAGDAIFEVSDFSASCAPHSSLCNYSFGVLKPGTMEKTPVKCSAQVQAAGIGELPDVKEGTCEGSSRTWEIVRTNPGLQLTVTQAVTPSTNEIGTHVISENELETSDEPNAAVQSYTGPKEFTLDSSAVN